jgi:hypothetical protein
MRNVVYLFRIKTAYFRKRLEREITIMSQAKVDKYKEEKKNFCTGKDCILIDDLEANIDSWRSYGGTGILHKDAESTLRILEEKGVL